MVTGPSPLDLLIEKIRILRHEGGGASSPPIRESGLTHHAPACSASGAAHLAREKADSRFPHASASESPVSLDPITLPAVLGPRPDPAAKAALEAELRQAIAQYRVEVATGVLGRGVLLVRGRPLADYLSLDDVARLIRTRGPR
jgi:hypothetical protein